MTPRPARLALVGLLLAAASLLLPASASAGAGILTFSSGPSTTQAGAHADIGLEFALSTHQVNPSPCDCTDARDITAQLPAGLIGNPHATPRCEIAQFAIGQCPVDSQVGVVFIVIATTQNDGRFGNAGFIAPVFNMVPPATSPGMLAFKAGLVNTPNFELISARTGSDYGLDVETVSIEHFAPPSVVEQLIWGVPAAHVHDDLRFPLGAQPVSAVLGIPYPCDAEGHERFSEPLSFAELCPQNSAGYRSVCGVLSQGPDLPCHSNSPEAPFIENPTSCGEASLATSLRVLAYDGQTTEAASPWPPTTGCAALSFEPSLFAEATTRETDSPSGINVDLKAPIFESPETPSPSEIRATTVTLPPGFTINAAAADGKTACADSEAKFGTTEEARCPEFAKLGTLEVHSPVLPGTLPGAIYIGRPLPGERYRLFLTFDGFGTHVKLVGTVHPDPASGQLVTEFKNLPQFPFEDFNLHFFGGERGILATPTQCGTYPVTTVFEPWDAALPDRTSTQYFTLDKGPGGTACPNGPRPFAPGLEIASSKNAAGAHTSFSLELTRSDGEQDLTALDVTTPPGFSATLAGVPYCPEAQIAAAEAPGYSGLLERERPACPAASLVGESSAGVGAGTHPFFAPGKVYLAGPYRGAPLSLVVITPAVEGPYDLGDVVVRAALHVNPETAQVSAVTESLPQILAGVPLRLRSILVNLNRPDFALNPTDCEPLAVQARASADEGASAGLSSPFQVANCARLPFAPQLALSLAGSAKRTGHPALKAVLRMRPGEANIARARVTLPHSEFLDQGHIGTVCTRVQFAEGGGNGERCPPASIYGYARAETPLLEKPLEGPVYLRSSSHKLPDLVAALNGQIQIALDGRIDSVNARLRSSFEVVPDAPVSKFTLEMQGGAKGLLVNSENLCGRPHRASADFSAQNGRLDDLKPIVTTACGRPRRRARLSRAREAR